MICLIVKWKFKSSLSSYCLHFSKSTHPPPSPNPSIWILLWSFRMILYTFLCRRFAYWPRTWFFYFLSYLYFVKLFTQFTLKLGLNVTHGTYNPHNHRNRINIKTPSPEIVWISFFSHTQTIKIAELVRVIYLWHYSSDKDRKATGGMSWWKSILRWQKWYVLPFSRNEWFWL